MGDLLWSSNTSTFALHNNINSKKPAELHKLIGIAMAMHVYLFLSQNQMVTCAPQRLLRKIAQNEFTVEKCEKLYSV